MKLVCLDTNIIILGVLGQGGPNVDDDLKQISKSFFEKLRHQQKTAEKKKKISIGIPSIVLAELLMKAEYPEDQIVAKLSQQGFMILPFDHIAAIYFGKIWRNKHGTGTIQNIRDHTDLTKSAVKADFQIVATAYRHKATHIFTHNRNHLKSFAENWIKVIEINTYLDLDDPDQLELF